MFNNINDEVNDEVNESITEEAPKIEKISLKDINQAKDDDLVARVMEQILKIK